MFFSVSGGEGVFVSACGCVSFVPIWGPAIFGLSSLHKHEKGINRTDRRTDRQDTVDLHSGQYVLIQPVTITEGGGVTAIAIPYQNVVRNDPILLYSNPQ